MTLVQVGGAGRITGLNGLTEGSVHSAETREAALQRARSRGFKGA